MSRILKRPMFRKGGPTNKMTGIMSGIQDRENFQDAGRVGELTKQNLDLLMQSDEGNRSFDPLTTFLLQYGPALASATPTGSTIGTLVGAAAKPIESMIAEKRAQEKYMRDIKAGATKLAIEQAGKENILAQEIAGRKDIEGIKATGKMDPLYASVLEQNIEEFGVDNLPAAQAATKFQTELAGDFRKKVSSRAGGVLKFDINDPEQAKANQKILEKNLGKVFYDPFTNTYVKIAKIAGVLSFDRFNTIEEIDLTMPSPAEKEKIDRSVPNFGMSMDDPSA
jgi:hypothetical protein